MKLIKKKQKNPRDVSTSFNPKMVTLSMAVIFALFLEHEKVDEILKFGDEEDSIFTHDTVDVQMSTAVEYYLFFILYYVTFIFVFG